MGNLDCKIIGIEWQYIAEIENATWPVKGLDFKKSNSQIIQMRNGMGKSTTTFLLRHLFSGVLPTIENHKIIFERSVYAGGNISPLGKKYQKEGQISVKLDINGQNWVIGLRFDYEAKKAKFFHVHPTEGNRPGWDAPQSFKDLFQDNEEFSELFLIVAEEAGSRQTSLNANMINGSIMGVTPLRNLKNLIIDLEETYTKKIKKIGSNPGKEKLKMYQNAVTKLESLINKKEKEEKRVRQERNDHKSKCKILSKKLKGLEDKSKIKIQLAEEREALKSQGKEVDNAVKELRNSYLNPSNIDENIWHGVTNVFKCLDELKLPEAITKHVVKNIRDKGHCICGEEIIPGSKMDKHLIHFENDCIESTVQEEAIRIKTSIIDSKSENGADKLFDQLKKENKKLTKISMEIKRLKGLLPDDLAKQIDDLEGKIGSHEDEIAEKDRILKSLTSTDISIIAENNWSGKAILKNGSLSSDQSDYNSCINIPTLKKGLKHFSKLRDDIADIHYYNQANMQIISLIEKTINETLQYLRDKVKISANKHFKPFQSYQMEIISLDDGVKFEDKSGNKKSGANTGAELSAQYSILLALTEIANVKVPLIIDNPVKGFDGGAGIYFDENMPSKVNQLLLIIISGTQERQQMPEIIKQSESLSTLCRENESISGKDPGGGEPSGNVIVKDDRNWFMNYNPPKKEKDVE